MAKLFSFLSFSMNPAKELSEYKWLKKKEIEP